MTDHTSFLKHDYQFESSDLPPLSEHQSNPFREPVNSDKKDSPSVGSQSEFQTQNNQLEHQQTIHQRHTPTRKSEDNKSSDPNYILNPQTGRYVLKTGGIGRRLLYGDNPPPKKKTSRLPTHRRVYKITKISRQQEQSGDSIQYVDPAELTAKRNGRRSGYKIMKIGRHDPIPDRQKSWVQHQQLVQVGEVRKKTASSLQTRRVKVVGSPSDQESIIVGTTSSSSVSDKDFKPTKVKKSVSSEHSAPDQYLAPEQKIEIEKKKKPSPPSLNQLRELLECYQSCQDQTISEDPEIDQSTKARPSSRPEVDTRLAVAVAARTTKPAMMSTPLCVYTDGSVTNNQRNNPLAQGGIGIYFGPRDSRNVSQKFRYHPTTNQRTELYAIIKALKIIRQTEPVDRPIIIFTDSQYALKTLKKTWKAKENLDLLKKGWQLLAEQTGLGSPIEIKHIKAHTNRTDSPHFIGNAQADKLANLGREK